MTPNKGVVATVFALGLVLGTVIAAQLLVYGHGPGPETRQSSCWWAWYDNASNIISHAHVWNLTEESGAASCTMLKDMCFNSQINHVNGNLGFNCRWLYNSDMYGNDTCLCSYFDVPGGVLNASA